MRYPELHEFHDDWNRWISLWGFGYWQVADTKYLDGTECVPTEEGNVNICVMRRDGEFAKLVLYDYGLMSVYTAKWEKQNGQMYVDWHLSHTREFGGGALSRRHMFTWAFGYLDSLLPFPPLSRVHVLMAAE